MATPQFLTKNPNFLHEAFLDIYTADPRWLRLSDNFYENHDGLMYIPYMHGTVWIFVAHASEIHTLPHLGCR